MLQKLIIVFVLIHISVFSFAQQNGFEIILDSPTIDELALDFVENGNVEYIGVVNKTSFINYNTIPYIYLINNLGDTTCISFEKQDSSFNYYHIERVINEPSGFIMIGIGVSQNNVFTVITRIDNNANIVWDKTFNSELIINSAWRASVIELKDSGFLYACSPNEGGEMFLLRLSPDGDSLDYKEYYYEDAGYVVDLTYDTNSTNILLSTEWAHYETGGFVSSVIMLDDSLNQIDVNYYPEWFRYPYRVIGYDDKFLIGGREQVVHVSGPTEKYICAYMLDSLFNVLYEFHLTNPDTVSWGAETRAIDYYYPDCIFLGGTFNRNFFSTDEPSWIYIAKLNDTLGLEFEKYIGGDYKYWLNSVNATTDGGVLLTASYQDFLIDTVNRDALIIKIDSAGLITNTFETSKFIISDAIIYPNPGKDILNIRTALTDCIFNLYDILGRREMSVKLENLVTTINVQNFPPGEYLYTVTKNNKNIHSGTCIKTKN